MENRLLEPTLTQRVIEILASISKRKAEMIAPDDLLIEDLGIDSIQFLELFAELEEKFQFELDVEDLQPELVRSVRSLVAFVQVRVNR